MFTYAPLPSWIELARALKRAPPAGADLAAAWRRDGDVAGWLSRSAWSLALINQWRQRRAPGAPVVFWVPDYFCNSSLLAVRHAGATLVFYPVGNDLAPDMAACRVLAETSPPDLFLLVHFFGRPAPTAQVRDLCARHQAWMIEDAAHVLRPIEGVGTAGDFVIYSPHKHLPIPDGAVLVARASGPGRLDAATLSALGDPEGWPGQLSDLRRTMGSAVSQGTMRTTSWLVTRMLLKLGVRRPSAGPAFRESVPPVDPVPGLMAPEPTRLARRLLAVLTADLSVIARRRQRAQVLWDALTGAPVAERPAGRDWTPYLAAYQFDEDTAQRVHDRWQRDGLPVTSWPDIAPEVTAHRDAHVCAWRLRHSRVYLPVHQTLRAPAMAAAFREAHAQSASTSLTWAWDRETPEQWESWLAQAERSNLLQLWGYGDAKATQSGWRVTRGVLRRGAEPVAIVQALRKRVGGLVSVTRISRGPLMLTALDGRDQRAMWKAVAQLGRVWRGTVLSVSPELPLTGDALRLMADLGFRQFSPAAWESAWLDLEPDLDALRKQLDRKWRNMLTASEKAGLTVEIGSDDLLFEWMLGQYQELMRQKHFDGPPVELLRALRTRTPLIIVRAMKDGDAVAAVCLARHGAAATYLLGWNGAAGRPLKANQFLMWQSIEHLKAGGIRWFDLGGISEELTPGVAAFKLGLNGERYELVGEYWKW